MRLILPAIALLIASACGDDEPGLADARANDAGVDAASVEGDLLGSIVVAASAWLCCGADTGLATARFFDHPDPPFHVVTATEGSCRYLEYRQGFCEDPCDGFCSEEHGCVPWPTRRSAGTLTIDGLAAPAVLEPDTYAYYRAELPFALFAAGDAITASAPGDAFDGFAVSAPGVAALAGVDIGAADGVAVMGRGHEFAISWTAGDPADRVRLVLRSPTLGHGAPSEARIVCEGPDTGSFTIPAAWTETFPDSPGIVTTLCFGRDCPESTLARYSRGAVEAGGGVVELVVESRASFALQTAVLALEPIVLAADSYPLGLAVDETHAYYTLALVPPGGRVRSVPLAGGDAETLAYQQNGAFGIAADDSDLFWALGNGRAIATMSKTGGDVTHLASDQDHPAYVAVDATHVYWTNNHDTDGEIVKVEKGGGVPFVLASGQANPGYLALDDDYVYWTTFSGGTVARVAKTGGPVLEIATGQVQPSGIAVDDARVYWTNFGGGTIMSAEKTGGLTVKILAGGQSGGPVSIAVDDQYAYWITNAMYTGRVVRVDKGGTGDPLVLVEELSNGHSIAVDDEFVYFTTTVGQGMVAKVPK